MKPLLMRHSEAIDESFKVWQNGNPYKHNPWHYHPEFEITYIRKGNGTLYIGDEMINYSNNDVIIIGSNLPHEMRSAILASPDLQSESISIHFNASFLGEDFMNLPEVSAFKDIMQRSLRGIKIEDDPKRKLLIKNINLLIKATGLQKLSKLLEIIHIISECPHMRYLSSSSFTNSIDHAQNHKINKVYQYVMKNFSKEKISIEEVASTVNMVPTSFCRFFKERTNKQFIKFLNEIRTGYACRLLLEDKLSIGQIAYESGFGTVSNFNKQFKSVKGTAPSLFVKNYHRKAGKMDTKPVIQSTV